MAGEQALLVSLAGFAAQLARCRSGLMPIRAQPLRRFQVGSSARQARRSGDLDAPGSDRIGPLDAAEVPLRQRQGLRGHHQVLLVAGVGAADLRPLPVEDDPQLVGLTRPIGEVESHDHPPIGQAVVRQVPADPRVQHDPRIEVLGRQLQPTLAPRAHGQHDAAKIVAGLGETVPRAAPVLVRSRLDDTGAFELTKPRGQERSGDARGAGGDLAEGRRAEQQVAQDEGSPAYGEDLRGPGDRTVLAIRAHAVSVAQPAVGG